MWALRPASNIIKNRVLSLGFFPLCHMRSEIAVSPFDERNMDFGPSQSVFDNCFPLNKLYHSESRISCCSVGKNTFCSKAGTRSSKEELDDGFSEMSVASDDADIGNIENVDDLISKAEHSEDVEDGGNLNKSSRTNKKISKFALNSELFKIVSFTRIGLLDSALDKWIEDGRCCKSEEIKLVINALCERQMYGRALKFWEWLEKNKKHYLKDESDYAVRVDLIAKTKGVPFAEKYIESIPVSLRGERVYGTLMANCVYLKKSDKRVGEIFSKMKALRLRITSFTYDQMLIVYKRINNSKKISGVLHLMEQNSVKPTLETYNVLIRAKVRSNDLAGIETILKKMKAGDIRPDFGLQSLLVRFYVSVGDKGKAEAILKEIEAGNIKRPLIRFLLPLYATLGNADTVKRLCDLCERDTTHEEHVAVIEAWGKLHNIEMAESCFKNAANDNMSVPLRLYHTLLHVYVDHRQLAKAKDLVQQMKAKGCLITSYCWESLGKLFLWSGDLGKAEMALRRAEDLEPKGFL